MTEADVLALKLLVAQKGVLIRPGCFGDYLWGAASKRRNGNCSCPFARQAGKVLNRLKARGFAECVREGKQWGWRATESGRTTETRISTGSDWAKMYGVKK